MVKMFNEDAAWLVLMLATRDVSTGNALQIAEDIRQDPTTPEETRDALYLAIRTVRNEQRSGGDVVKQIYKGLEVQLRGGAVKEETLIDRMVNVLQRPFVRNVLSYEAIASLRKIFLTQEELSKLDTILTTAETCCTGCGKRLSHREMMTINRQQRSSSDIQCVKCNPPQLIPCTHAGCTKCVGVTAKQAKILSSPGFCEEHRPGRAAETAAGVGGSEVAGVDIETPFPAGSGLIGEIARSDNAFFTAQPAQAIPESWRPYRTTGIGYSAPPGDNPRRGTRISSENAPPDVGRGVSSARVGASSPSPSGPFRIDYGQVVEAERRRIREHIADTQARIAAARSLPTEAEFDGGGDDV